METPQNLPEEAPFKEPLTNLQRLLLELFADNLSDEELVAVLRQLNAYLAERHASGDTAHWDAPLWQPNALEELIRVHYPAFALPTDSPAQS